MAFVLASAVSMFKFSLICLLYYLQKLNFESAQVVGSASVTTPSEKDIFQYPPSPGGKTPSSLPSTTDSTVTATPASCGPTGITTTTVTTSVTATGTDLSTTTTVTTTSATSDVISANVTTAAGTVFDGSTTPTLGTVTGGPVVTTTTTKAIPITKTQTDVNTTAANSVSTTCVESKIVRSSAMGSKKFTVTPVDESKQIAPKTDERQKEQNGEEQSQSRVTSTSRQISHESKEQTQSSESSESKSVPMPSDDRSTQGVDSTQNDVNTPIQKESVLPSTEQQTTISQQNQQPPAQTTQQSQPQGGSTQSQRAPGMKSEYSVESLPSGYTSQESTVPRAKAKGQEHMDFENLKQKLDQLSGKQKPGAETKPQASLPTTPCNQAGVDSVQPSQVGQLPSGTPVSLSTSTHQQMQAPSGQTTVSQHKGYVGKELQPTTAQTTVIPNITSQANVPAHPVSIQQSQQLPISAVQMHHQPGGHLPQVHGQQVQGVNQQIALQQVFQNIPAQPHPQQQFAGPPVQSQQQQHNQALNYNTWHGNQNPVCQQPMAQTLHYLQQQHQLQQQQQQLQQLQNLLHQQQQIQQQLAAGGIYVPINQISLPHASSLVDTHTMFNPRRQLEFGVDPQQHMHNTGGYPSLAANALLSPPPTHPLSSVVRPTGALPGIPTVVPDQYATTPKMKRVERPADIHNLEQALIEKLHSHKRTTHLPGHHAYVHAPGHDVASLLSTPSNPGQLLQGAPPQIDSASQLVNPEQIEAIPHQPQEYSDTPIAIVSGVPNDSASAPNVTNDEAEQKALEAENGKVELSEEISEVNRDVVEPAINTVKTEDLSAATDPKKSVKSRFSVTIVKDDPLKAHSKSDNTTSQEKVSAGIPSKSDSGEKEHKAVPSLSKITKRQVSKRGRFQVTTVKDPFNDPATPVSQESSVGKTEHREVVRNNSVESVKSEAKDSLAPTSLSDRLSSLTSGSDYQRTLDSIPTSGENSAENTAGTEITSGLSKAVSTLAQQITQDSYTGKAPETKVSADTSARTTSTSVSSTVATTKDVQNCAMAVSTCQMAGLGAVHPHQSVNPPLVAHMVTDTLPHLAGQHPSSHQHFISPSSLPSVNNPVGGSGTTLPHSVPPTFQQTAIAGAPLLPSTVAATNVPNSANVSMQSWRKHSLPVLVEMSACGSINVDVDDESFSHTSLASHMPSVCHHSRHNSLPCVMHAENKCNPHRSNIGTSVIHPQITNNSNLGSTRLHHSVLKTLHRENRRQSAPAVHSNLNPNAMMRGNEHVAHDGFSAGVHAEASWLGYHRGLSPPAVYAPGSCVSMEVSYVFFYYLN